MDMVKSKVFGMGKVINKEVKEKGTYITVEFESGRQLVFGVPGSFLTGALEAVGSFKEEVDKAIAERKALEAAERESKKTETPASDESKKTVKHSKKSPGKVMPTGKPRSLIVYKIPTSKNRASIPGPQIHSCTLCIIPSVLRPPPPNHTVWQCLPYIFSLCFIPISSHICYTDSG